MRRFELVEPVSIGAATAALAEDLDRRAIAGGTALLVLIKQGVYIPTTLVNLQAIAGMDEITFDDRRGLRLGALATIGRIERDRLVRERYPVLAQACHAVANVRIRNLATIGGNLAHADSQSDPATALVALDARVELQGPDGTRELALREFLRGPYETACLTAELVTAILVPPMAAGWRSAYLRFTTRSSEDRPSVGLAALARVEDGRCVDARLVVGAATPVPVRVAAADAHLRGRRLDEPLSAEAGAIVEGSIEPIDDLRGSADYKRRVAGVLAERALVHLAGPAA